MKKTYYVYILASKRNGTLYIGVTNDLSRRMYEHKEGLADGFTKTYGIKTLVYYEVFDGVNEAIAREKRLKKYKRERIESVNLGQHFRRDAGRFRFTIRYHSSDAELL